jgi:hypothetical protein
MVSLPPVDVKGINTTLLRQELERIAVICRMWHLRCILDFFTRRQAWHRSHYRHCLHGGSHSSHQQRIIRRVLIQRGTTHSATRVGLIQSTPPHVGSGNGARTADASPDTSYGKSDDLDAQLFFTIKRFWSLMFQGQSLDSLLILPFFSSMPPTGTQLDLQLDLLAQSSCTLYLSTRVRAGFLHVSEFSSYTRTQTNGRTSRANNVLQPSINDDNTQHQWPITNAGYGNGNGISDNKILRLIRKLYICEGIGFTYTCERREHQYLRSIMWTSWRSIQHALRSIISGYNTQHQWPITWILDMEMVIAYNMLRLIRKLYIHGEGIGFTFTCERRGHQYNMYCEVSCERRGHQYNMYCEVSSPATTHNINGQ